MNSYTIRNLKDFQLDHIFDCGQCFRWNRTGLGIYSGMAMGRRVTMEQRGDSLTVTPCTKEEFDTIWRPYLDLDRDYGRIKEILAEKDPVMARACEWGTGIRILQQDLWEVIVSFIISQNNNIPRIKGCIERLCRLAGAAPEGEEDRRAPVQESRQEPGQAVRQTPGQEGLRAFGANVGLDGDQYPDFPSAQTLAALEPEDLAPARLGYRARYVIETARQVAEHGLPQTADQVLFLSGVGPKVANCILLFGMKKYDSFPIDVWVRRVMHELYGFREEDVKGMKAFAAAEFGEFGGFAQQYLFYYMRSL